MSSTWDNKLTELKALVETEEIEGYGATQIRSCAEICRLWYEMVDQFGISRDVVPMAWNFFSRYAIANGQCVDKKILPTLINASLFLAIKVKVRSIAEEDVAEEGVRALAALSNENSVLDMEQGMIQALEWRVNPPSMHEFAERLVDLHPLARCDKVYRAYLRETACHQAEQAVFHSELMMNYRPSIIAAAAIMRAQDELNPRVLTENMRGKFLGLQSSLKMDHFIVNEAISALENFVPRIPDLEEFQNFAPAQATVGAEGSISPTGVGSNCESYS
eukprot:CAMPEP_0172553842 /NCGR_PEP_ID=MMETSP1067-20121228/51940_1 /TAXON_ID=265564 ORGANISM="Thalassiosira punctigera, Strain Tpunct2005C2" /NCGR_SAMPLE_ID=MMETSP1067 /ASSEMBLY_ACC=CAM_ASM_000444 /LENGTH=275 /DNA_ID=CAMNT_0013342089 /DNA_START=80 /DNA_END=907 /DNA_ORIENTATION=+